MSDFTMTGTPEYDALTSAMSAAKAQIRTVGKAAVGALFKAFFAANADVAAIGWTQYTPYFNDGDPCEFSVGDFAWSTAAGVDWAKVTTTYEGDDSGAGWRETWGNKGDKREREIVEAVRSLRRAVLDDIFEAAFGDHAMVIATPAGFHVSEYSHG